ncbi:MAG: hypothetical protein GF309_10560 [Candidatus Lokiarchaeota archaeon]|nr:hypothetical protein [Candidatus Lokiarchaeota archaeon]
MRIAGTRYSMTREGDAVELKKQGQGVQTFDVKDKTAAQVAEDIQMTLRRKGVIVQKSLLEENVREFFPEARKYGVLK